MLRALHSWTRVVIGILAIVPRYNKGTKAGYFYKYLESQLLEIVKILHWCYVFVCVRLDAVSVLYLCYNMADCGFIKVLCANWSKKVKDYDIITMNFRIVHVE